MVGSGIPERSVSRVSLRNDGSIGVTVSALDSMCVRGGGADEVG